MMHATTRQAKIHLGPVALTILAVIAVAGLVTVAVCAPNALQLLRPFFKKKKYSPKQVIARNIESLIRTGLVKRTFNNDGEPQLELTQRGKWESMLRNPFKRREKKKWDKKWRVVIFDISNEKEKLRLELRRGIRLYGFHLLQKSVWVYPYPCDDFVAQLREHLGLTSDVIYLTVSEIENEKTLRKEFKL